MFIRLLGCSSFEIRKASILGEYNFKLFEFNLKS
jgi:hypothetical protein